MIQICPQILEFSDQTQSISAVRLGKFPQRPFSHGPLWRILFLAWARCLVVDATKSRVEHTHRRCFVPFKDVSTLYRLVCLNKKHLDLSESVVGHWSLLGGSIFLAVLLAISPSNLLNSGQNTIIFRDKKTSSCSFFFSPKPSMN